MQEHRSQVCAASRKWPVLEPWCEFLRMTTRLRLTADSNDDLMVTVRLHPRQYWRSLSPNDIVLMCREALELLAMLAVVDVVSWQQLLVDRCGCEKKYKYWDDWTLPPRFWLKLGDSKAASECRDTDYYRVFFCDFDVSSPKRAKFRAAAMRIQNAMTSAMRFELARFDSFPMFVRCIPSRAIKTEENTAYLNGVVDMVKAAIKARNEMAIAASSAKKGANIVGPGRLVLDDIEVHTSRLTLPPGSSQILSEIMKLPVQTVGLDGGLNIGFDSVVGRLPATEFESLLTAMVNHPSPSSVATKSEALSSPQTLYVVNNGQVHTLTAICSLTLHWMAVCSAVAVAQHIDDFEMETVICGTGFGTRAKKYQWLAYSLLSKESATSVTKLAISDLDFYQQDINSILSILNAKNPASKLGGFTRTARDRAQFARAPQVPTLNAEEEAPGEPDDDASEDDYEIDEAVLLEAQGRAIMLNAMIDRAAAEQQLEAIGDEHGEIDGGALGNQTNDDEGDEAAAEVETNSATGDEAEAADPNDVGDDGEFSNGEDDEDEVDDENDDDEDQVDPFDIVNAAGMFGFGLIDPDDFDHEDDFDFELEDEAGIDDEDPDVRAYFTENFQDTGEQEHDDGHAVLKRGTMVQIDRFNPEGEDTEPESLVLDKGGEFRVITNDSSSEVVNIIVPGYGSCSVERAYVDHFVPIPECKTPSSMSLGYQGSITSLRLSYVTPVNAQIFLPILQYLGVKLTCLELAEHVFVTPESLNHVLEACPHLESLQFFTADESLQSVLVAAYAEERCRISKLHVGHVCPDTVGELIETLQDPMTAMAQKVQKLSLFHEHSTLFGETMLTAIVDMLQHNTVLEFFEIEFYPEEAEMFKSQLLEFHGQFLSGVKAQLPLECRLAFLSVLKMSSRNSAKKSNDGPSESKRARLFSSVDLERIDRGVLSLIFRFAAQRKTRRIRVHVPDDDRNRFFHERYLREQVDSDDESMGDAGW